MRGNPSSAGDFDPDTVRSSAARVAGAAYRPDCVKLEPKDIDVKGRERKLVEWMGRETRNLQLGSSEAIDATSVRTSRRASRAG